VETAKSGVWEATAFMWRQKAAFHVCMGGGVCALWGWGLVYWTPTFLQRAYHLNVAEAGALTGDIHLWGGLAATAGTAWLLSRPFMVHPKRAVLFLAIGIGLATIPSIIAYSTNSLSVCHWMFWLFIPAIYFYIGPCFGLLNNLAPCHMRNIFIAISLLVANVFNLIVAPQSVGFLSDFLVAHGQNNTESLRTALLFLAPTGFWATLHLFLAAKSIGADQERATEYLERKANC
jgi:hypothetical protein